MERDEELEKLIEAEPFKDRKWKKLSLMSSIMAGMLNGSIPWERGCAAREYINGMD